MKCYYCKDEAIEGKKLCEKHAKRKRKEQHLKREKRRKLGLCTDCGKERDTNLVRCSACTKKQKKNYKKRSQKRLDENCCTLCGRSKEYVCPWPNARCPRCHLKDKFGLSTTYENAENIINNLLFKQNYQCALTGRDLNTNKYHIDHIIPVSVDNSRKSDPSNWQIIVEDANMFKEDLFMSDVINLAIDIVKKAIKDGSLNITDIIVP